MPLRIYTPENANGSAILYTHGGGWIGGHLGVCDEPLRAIANETGAVVVASTYRLARRKYGVARGVSCGPPELTFNALMSGAGVRSMEVSDRLAS